VSTPLPDEQLLFEKYLPLVRRIAAALQQMKPAILEPNDVIQDGMIGLLRAIRANRLESSPAQFASFAGMTIRGAIIDGYRAAGGMSRHHYDQAKHTRQALAEGREVSPEARAQADETLNMAWLPACPIGDEATDEFSLAEPTPGPEQRAEANQLLRRAIDRLQEMPLRDRNIFIACELHGEKHSAVARRCALSNGRISQILQRVRQDILLALA
jgi:RNA polymerase sigma factor (sigma-70 family)